MQDEIVLVKTKVDSNKYQRHIMFHKNGKFYNIYKDWSLKFTEMFMKRIKVDEYVQSV